MFLAARCASHFTFNINSSHHYTNSLVAIAFYIEYCPSFIKSVKKRASLIKHCRLKFFSVVNDQIAVPSGWNCPSPLSPSSRHFVWLVVELGRFAYSFYIGKKYGVSCECGSKDTWVDVPEKHCKIHTFLQSSGSKVVVNLTLPFYRCMGVWILPNMVVWPSCCIWATVIAVNLSRTNTIPHHVPRPHRYYFYLTSLLITVSTQSDSETTSTNGTIRR